MHSYVLHRRINAVDCVINLWLSTFAGILSIALCNIIVLNTPNRGVIGKMADYDIDMPAKALPTGSIFEHYMDNDMPPVGSWTKTTVRLKSLKEIEQERIARKLQK